jgi:hypothetical protein
MIALSGFQGTTGHININDFPGTSFHGGDGKGTGIGKQIQYSTILGIVLHPSSTRGHV